MKFLLLLSLACLTACGQKPVAKPSPVRLPNGELTTQEMKCRDGLTIKYNEHSSGMKFVCDDHGGVVSDTGTGSQTNGGNQK